MQLQADWALPGLHNVIFGSGGAALAQTHLFLTNADDAIVWWLEHHVATVATRVRFPVTGRPAGLEFSLS